MEKPVFDEIEYRPISINQKKEDNTLFKMILNENDHIGKCALDQTFFNLDSNNKRDHQAFDNILVPGINRHAIPKVAPIS